MLVLCERILETAVYKNGSARVLITSADTAVRAKNGAQTVGRKTSWAKDVWANYFLGDRRLGDKLGRYGDSKSDGWATFFRRLGEMCERGKTQN